MKKVVKRSLIVIGSLFALVVALILITGIKPIALGWHSPVYNEGNIGNAGYDVMSYFEGRAEKGSAEYSASYNGLNWYFTSEEHLKQFQESPERFVPEFGGYCVKAVSTGFAVAPDPTSYAIYNDKLYVFSGPDIKAEFEKDPEALINSCNANWK